MNSTKHYRYGKFPAKISGFGTPRPFLSDDQKLLIFDEGPHSFRAYSISGDTVLKEKIFKLSEYDRYYTHVFLNEKNRLNYIVKEKNNKNRNRFLFYSPNRKFEMDAKIVSYIGGGYYSLYDSARTYLISPNLDTLRLDISGWSVMQKMKNNDVLMVGINGNFKRYSIEKQKIISDFRTIIMDTSKYYSSWFIISPDENFAVLNSFQKGLSGHFYFQVVDLNKRQTIRSFKIEFNFAGKMDFYGNSQLIYSQWYSYYSNNQVKQKEQIEYINWHFLIEPPKTFDSLKELYNSFRKIYPDSLLNLK